MRWQQEGPEEGKEKVKGKIVKNKKLGNVDDKTLVEQPQMGASGCLLRQQDAFLKLYKVVTKLCNLEKNWWRYK